MPSSLVSVSPVLYVPGKRSVHFVKREEPAKCAEIDNGHFAVVGRCRQLRVVVLVADLKHHRAAGEIDRVVIEIGDQAR